MINARHSSTQFGATKAFQHIPTLPVFVCIFSRHLSLKAVFAVFDTAQLAQCQPARFVTVAVGRVAMRQWQDLYIHSFNTAPLSVNKCPAMSRLNHLRVPHVPSASFRMRHLGTSTYFMTNETRPGLVLGYTNIRWTHLLIHEATELCTTHQKVQVWHQHEVKKTVSPTCRVQVSTFPQWQTNAKNTACLPSWDPGTEKCMQGTRTLSRTWIRG